MDKFKIYKHKDHDMYELRVFDGVRWGSSIWEPTIEAVKYHAYRMMCEDMLVEIFPSIPITEGSAELVWTGRDITLIG
jgi:hypothetical protein